MSGISLDMSQVRLFAADARAAPSALTRHLVPVLHRGALNIKTQLQDDLQASSNGAIRKIARTVSYDVNLGNDEFEAEIGPTKPDGALANIAYFGTPRGGGHTPDPRIALEAEAANFEKHIANLVEELI